MIEVLVLAASYGDRAVIASEARQSHDAGSGLDEIAALRSQ